MDENNAESNVAGESTPENIIKIDGNVVSVEPAAAADPAPEPAAAADPFGEPVAVLVPAADPYNFDVRISMLARVIQDQAIRIARLEYIVKTRTGDYAG